MLIKTVQCAQGNRVCPIGYVAFDRIQSVQDDILHSIRYNVFKRTQCVMIKCASRKH